MNKFVSRSDLFFLVVAVLAVIGFLCVDGFGQSSRESLTQQCAGTAKASIKISAGFVDLTPCPTKSVRVNGSPIAITGLASLNGIVGSTQTFATGTNDAASWSSAGTTHTLRLPITGVSGVSRVNTFPYFNAANTLAKSPFSWDGTSFLWRDLNEVDEWKMTVVPDVAGAGYFAVGDYEFGPTSFLTLQQNGYLGGGLTRVSSSKIEMGDILLAANRTVLTIDDVNDRVDLDSTGSTLLGLLGVRQFVVNKTNTAPGTNGAQTINKAFGTVNVAPAASTLVVTNSSVTANSIVYATANFNDATCSVKSAIPAAGSFTITMTAACTAATKVGFWVVN